MGNKIIAIPGVNIGSYHYPEEKDVFKRNVSQCLSPGWHLIDGFNGPGDLVTKIEDILKNDPDHLSLEILEIDAHGAPWMIDGLSHLNITTYGDAFKNLNSWSDEASIYLSGCNTGLAYGTYIIAELLAASMKFDQNNFARKITVYGSAGYLSGTIVCKNSKTKCVYIQPGEVWKKRLKFVWTFITTFGNPIQAALEASSIDVQHKPYSGCRIATGKDAYNEFKNWT